MDSVRVYHEGKWVDMLMMFKLVNYHADDTRQVDTYLYNPREGSILKKSKEDYTPPGFSETIAWSYTLLPSQAEELLDKYAGHPAVQEVRRDMRLRSALGESDQ